MCSTDYKPNACAMEKVVDLDFNLNYIANSSNNYINEHRYVPTCKNMLQKKEKNPGYKIQNCR